MKIHHLNCGTLCPYCARLINGKGGWTEKGRLVCHCLALETKVGVVLVDTGFGVADVEKPKARLGGAFLALTQPTLKREETALAQLEAMGFSAKDVTHIVPTHLDLDHAGGLSDYPHATVHVLDAELAQITRPTARDKVRFRALQFAHGPRWAEHRNPTVDWFGFKAIAPIAELTDDLLMVPLVGHTKGHCGVAVRNGSKWLLHCGDAYFHRAEVGHPDPMPAGLRIFEKLVQTWPQARIDSQARLKALAEKHGAEVELFCAHDPEELARYQ